MPPERSDSRPRGERSRALGHTGFHLRVRTGKRDTAIEPRDPHRLTGDADPRGRGAQIRNDCLARTKLGRPCGRGVTTSQGAVAAAIRGGCSQRTQATGAGFSAWSGETSEDASIPRKVCVSQHDSSCIRACVDVSPGQGHAVTTAPVNRQRIKLWANATAHTNTTGNITSVVSRRSQNRRPMLEACVGPRARSRRLRPWRVEWRRRRRDEQPEKGGRRLRRLVT